MATLQAEVTRLKPKLQVQRQMQASWGVSQSRAEQSRHRVQWVRERVTE